MMIRVFSFSQMAKNIPKFVALILIVNSINFQSAAYSHGFFTGSVARVPPNDREETYVREIMKYELIDQLPEDEKKFYGYKHIEVLLVGREYKAFEGVEYVYKLKIHKPHQPDESKVCHVQVLLDKLDAVYMSPGSDCFEE